MLAKKIEKDINERLDDIDEKFNTLQECLKKQNGNGNGNGNGKGGNISLLKYTISMIISIITTVILIFSFGSGILDKIIDTKVEAQTSKFNSITLDNKERLDTWIAIRTKDWEELRTLLGSMCAKQEESNKKLDRIETDLRTHMINGNNGR